MFGARFQFYELFKYDFISSSMVAAVVVELGESIGVIGAYKLAQVNKNIWTILVHLVFISLLLFSHFLPCFLF